MRIALLADLHANREAVEACLAHAARAGAERYVFLGDLVGYGADPGWVVDTVMERVGRGDAAVYGNHDEAALLGPSERMSGDARASAEWTAARLTEPQRAFLAGLPLSVEDGPCLYVHANAWDPGRWAYVRGTAEARRSLEATERRVTLCGHVHQPALYHQAPGGPAIRFEPAPGAPVPLGGRRRWLAIPGSVGQPRDGNPAACCAVLDATAGVLTFHRVPYDHEAAADKVRRAGLPPRLAARLREGG
ncbi:metallophosphoesterase family protein [Azospirillum sp.]|uniref:metallophosphoesterase family protein n=1 Tax=Azospirillum sp. TaxID=34012 RepID=UPI003D74DD34